MNTSEPSRDHGRDTGGSVAVGQAQTGATAWQTAARTQGAAPADHSDFYALAGSMVETVRALEELAGVLVAQVRGYPTSVAPERRIYDDTRTYPPQQRLDVAVIELQDLAWYLGQAARRADAFWSAIGHLGVEETPPMTAHNSANDNAGRDSTVNGAVVAGADARWVRLGPWWVSQAGLDAVATRLGVRRLLAQALVYVVLRKTYHRGQTPAQIAAYFATTFPNVVPLADEGFIRYILAAVERPQQPEQGPADGRPVMSTVLILAVLVAAALVVGRRGSWGVALGLCGLAVLPAVTLLGRLPGWLMPVVGVLAGGVAWHLASRSTAVVTRWSGKARRRAGVASTLDIYRHASARAMRTRAATVRPSLAGLGRWARWRLPVTEVGMQLCRAGWLQVWSSVEDVVMVFGGPRSGKTGWLAGRVLDAPGAVLVTSTRTDLHALCSPLRSRRGPVLVFNPVGLAGIGSTITFDPLTGCTDAVTAAERATDMLAAVSRGAGRGGGGDREFWDAQARRVLAALLHAAALGGRSMPEVQGWLADPDKAAREVPALLRKSGVPGLEQDALQFIGTNERTRTSITSSVMPALGWLNHPAATAAATLAHGPDVGFDVEELLASRATVFLLGAEEAQTGPLVCALTGHIAREARRLAATAPAGRLDPPLTLALDEAALISPVPLESWTADMGGRGVTIIAAFQSRAQLLARWGEHNTATILNNTGAVMVFAGTRDRDDLTFWAALSGDRDERISTTDMHGQVASRSVRRVPVLQAAQIANLPVGRVLLIRRGLNPVIGRVQMAWRRYDVRAYEFALDHPDWAARLTHWARAARHQWERLTGPMTAAASAFAHQVDERARRVAGVVAGRVRRRAVSWRERTAVQVMPVDLDERLAAAEPDAATVPLPVIPTEVPTPGERPALISGGGSTP